MREALNVERMHVDIYRKIFWYELMKKTGGEEPTKEDVLLSEMLANSLFEKSAMMRRIVKGESIYIAPPPLSYSYPCYGYLDSENRAEISLAGQDVDSVFLGQRNPWEIYPGMPVEDRKYLTIGQTWWYLIEKIDEKSMIVSAAGWEKLGVTWKLSLEKYPATESEICIMCGHDREGGRITTGRRLYQEQVWHERRAAEEMRFAADELLSKQYIQEGVDLDALRNKGDATFITRFEEFSRTNQMNASKKMVEQRIAAGKSPIPDESEILLGAQSKTDAYMNPRAGNLADLGWYELDDRDNLLLNRWRMQRVLSPGLAHSSLVLDVGALPIPPEDFLSNLYRGLQ